MYLSGNTKYETAERIRFLCKNYKLPQIVDDSNCDMHAVVPLAMKYYDELACEMAKNGRVGTCAVLNT